MQRFPGLTLLFILFSVSVSGQDFIELGQIGYRYTMESQGYDDSGEDVSVAGWRGNLLVPLKISEKTYLLPGVRYWQFNLNPGNNFRYFFMQAGFQTKISEKASWQFLPLIRTGIYEDADFGDGFQLGLLTIINKKVKENLSLGYGIYTNDELFGMLLTPVLAIDWEITDRLRLFGNFPMFNTLSYTISEKVRTGINYVGLVTTFQGDDTYTERQSIDLSWFFDFYLTPQIVAQVHAGYPIGRTYEEFNEEDKVDFSLSLFRFGDDRTAVSTFDNAAMFVTFNLQFRIKK
jgi:hypothetical protein